MKHYSRPHTNVKGSLKSKNSCSFLQSSLSPYTYSAKAIGNTYSKRMQYFKVKHICVFTDLFSICLLPVYEICDQDQGIKSKSWAGGQKPSFYGEQMKMVNYASEQGNRVRNCGK